MDIQPPSWIPRRGLDIHTLAGYLRQCIDAQARAWMCTTGHGHIKEIMSMLGCGCPRPAVLYNREKYHTIPGIVTYFRLQIYVKKPGPVLPFLHHPAKIILNNYTYYN
jgi:hypothetical protein